MLCYVLPRVAKFPNPDAPGVPGSGRDWVLGAIAYIACWIIWIFGVFLGYEIIYSFYRRWRFRELSSSPTPVYRSFILHQVVHSSCPYTYPPRLSTLSL